MRGANIPTLPSGDIGRRKPEPPKYLQQADGTIIKISGAGGPKRLGIDDPKPIVSRISDTIPSKDYTLNPHGFMGKSESKGGRVDSRNLAKGVYVTKPDQDSNEPAMPKYVGSTYHHLPNTPSYHYGPLPKNPTIARAYIPPPKSAYQISPNDTSTPSHYGNTGVLVNTQSTQLGGLLHARTSSGEILGSPKKRIINANHVPYISADSYMAMRATKSVTADGGVDINALIASVNEENNVQQLTEMWCACFDNEAKAIYYYNNQTGEATWVQPPELMS